MTFRDGGSKDRIGIGTEALFQDCPLLDIRGRCACPARQKGAAYYVGVGGGGGGKKGSWRKF